MWCCVDRFHLSWSFLVSGCGDFLVRCVRGLSSSIPCCAIVVWWLCRVVAKCMLCHVAWWAALTIWVVFLRASSSSCLSRQWCSPPWLWFSQIAVRSMVACALWSRALASSCASRSFGGAPPSGTSSEDPVPVLPGLLFRRGVLRWLGG